MSKELFTLFFSACLVLTSCGGGDDSDAGGDSATDTSADHKGDSPQSNALDSAAE